MTDTCSGSCQCGAVRYEVPRQMKTTAKCHCQMCQKSTGASASTGAVYAESDLRVTGQLKRYTYTSDRGNPVTTHFCPNCASKIYISNPIGFPGLALVFAGTLDDTTMVEPQFVVFSKRRPAWDGDNPAIPHFAEMPNS